MTRRSLIGSSAAAAWLASSSSSLSHAEGTRLPIKKGLLWSMLPAKLSPLEKFQMLKACGFDEMECQTTADQAAAEAILDASKKTGVRIHSVMNMDHWRYPLSSNNRADVDRCIAGMETSIKNARLWGADSVLLVPGVVNPEVQYSQVWERSQKEIKRMLPLAKEQKVIIAVENVWNKFLLSPMEFVRYVDDFKSPFLKAYFDAGNILLYGFPQDWIRTLGPRIVKIHLKDFKFKGDPSVRGRSNADWVNLRDGMMDWKEVHKALAEIGYKGTMTVELNGGDEAYLKDVSSRFDMILNGQ
jgi:L-ribulose-5-phosphate 3-epimerase